MFGIKKKKYYFMLDPKPANAEELCVEIEKYFADRKKDIEFVSRTRPVTFLLEDMLFTVEEINLSGRTGNFWRVTCKAHK